MIVDKTLDFQFGQPSEAMVWSGRGFLAAVFHFKILLLFSSLSYSWIQPMHQDTVAEDMSVLHLFLRTLSIMENKLAYIFLF